MTDFIDIPELQRRGILKRAEQKKEISAKTGIIDFTQNLADQTVPQAPQTESSPFSFLNSLASSAQQTTEQNSYFNQETSTTQDKNSVEAKLSTLSAKFEDLEYKINNLIDRLIQLESKIGK